MARVSLILLRSPATDWPSDRVDAYREGLDARGLEVEVIVVDDPSGTAWPSVSEPWCRSVLADSPGLAEAAVAGLRAAKGPLLVVVDLAMAYSTEDLLAVVDRLDSKAADLVIATRRRPLTGKLALRWLGTTDPTSGLLGLTREAALDADDSLAPAGSRFGLELLARVAGRRADVPVGTVASSSRPWTPFGDLRQLKRLADDRFGNISRLLQFCFVGASGMVVDLTFYAMFQAILARTGVFEGMTAPLVGGPMTLAVAAVMSIGIALTWNFTINRRLTFNDARGGSILRQFGRYVLSNMLGVALSYTLRLRLPTMIGFFDRHRLAAALVGIVAATGISFSMARWLVFGRKSEKAGDRPGPAPKRRIDGFRPLPRSSANRMAARRFEGSTASGR